MLWLRALKYFQYFIQDKLYFLKKPPLPSIPFYFIPEMFMIKKSNFTTSVNLDHPTEGQKQKMTHV